MAPMAVTTTIAVSLCMRIPVARLARQHCGTLLWYLQFLFLHFPLAFSFKPQ
jgi:hypothetical protein